ncbi:flagellar basal body-associated FliL family protein [Polycladidibacter hongkongensis]|uniref:flagellar basal body-associated FliL family protein n=1 Tax=Polycladidibacter hongkongensis TaxID=1647556 RepID=UPI000836713A|nr:flagellar basal body-associated FliL family protein [Pseudovibrio hongkongensis]
MLKKLAGDMPQTPSALAFAGVTALAILAGGLLGAALVDRVHTQLIEERKAEAPGMINPVYASDSEIVALKPIVTNLLSSSENWIRIESSVVLKKTDMSEEDHAVLAKEIEQDFLLYARTLGPRQLQGTRGLLRLRDDLNERAKMRGGRVVRELVLESVVIQ